ncbi:MAG: alginate lyase family protein [Proteobacteria bacterium]|nr:alginate lyase family protein [Pseudomonadota bacterium]
MDVAWYIRRFRAMGPREIGRRAADALKRQAWRRRYFARGAMPEPCALDGERRFIGGLGRAMAPGAPGSARQALLETADALLEGRWQTFAIPRTDVTPDVDWQLDPKSGASLGAGRYTFAIRIHGEGLGLDTKYVWELSRHHHTTVLAMAYWLSGEPRYAEAAAAHVSAWCAANPFLHGVHWSSGIELGMRLVAFVWTRRLLADWPRATSQFEGNPLFVRSVHAHQWLLARRPSLGSSANNHRIYELLGLYEASAAMPWFAESAGWRRAARAALEREFHLQTFPSGLNRELASGYNIFSFEALALCLVESRLTGEAWAPADWNLAADILFRLASMADCKGHPARQGDSDDAQALLLDAPGFDQAVDLLRLGAAWFGAADWWPVLAEQPLRSWLWSRIAAPPVGRLPPPVRSPVAEYAGLVVLRAASNTPDEIYCAFDAGPLGYLSIAAHGHADALAVELRVGGQPILVDPGTFNYVAERRWRDYFRSTAAHNTLELGGEDQSVSGGPFLWTRHAKARLLSAEGLAEDTPVARVSADHDGYGERPFAGSHRREVRLDRNDRTVEIRDAVCVNRSTMARLHFHLHPSVRCNLAGTTATLRWMAEGAERSAVMELPSAFAWRAISGSDDPILGWYSPSYDVKLPTVTLAGEALIDGAISFQTSIRVA